MVVTRIEQEDRLESFYLGYLVGEGTAKAKNLDYPYEINTLRLVEEQKKSPTGKTPIEDLEYLNLELGVNHQKRPVLIRITVGTCCSTTTVQLRECGRRKVVTITTYDLGIGIILMNPNDIELLT
jgi:hypothetical protein